MNIGNLKFSFGIEKNSGNSFFIRNCKKTTVFALVLRSPSSSSPYSTTYSSNFGIPSSNLSRTSNSGISSSLDKYYNYLDDLSSISGTGSSRRRGSTDYGKSSNTVTYNIPISYSSTSLRSKYFDRAGSEETTATSSLAKGPKYDSFGKTLSNYDRWKLRQDQENNNINNDSSNTTTDRTGGARSKRLGVRFANITTDHDDSPPPLTTAKDDIFNTSTSLASASKFGRNSIPSSSSSYRSSFGSSSTVRNFPAGVGDKVIQLCTTLKYNSLKV